MTRDGHFRITNLEGFESFRIRMDSDPLGSGLERFEFFWIRLPLLWCMFFTSISSCVVGFGFGLKDSDPDSIKMGSERFGLEDSQKVF